MDRNEMSTLYRGPPIDASYQVSVHLASGFRREEFLKSAFHSDPLTNMATTGNSYF
jgi:hypothetical protein